MSNEKTSFATNSIISVSLSTYSVFELSAKKENNFLRKMLKC